MMFAAVIDRPTRWLRARSWAWALWLGVAGSIVLSVCSYTVGATRSRGGVMQALGLSSLTTGHMAGVFSVVLWIGVALLVISWAVAGGLILRTGRSLSWQMIAAWAGPLILAAPLMSRDIYSYLMQGTLARDGFNAYEVGAAANPGPLLFEVSGDWRNTTTPYGPAHLWLGDGITRITGDNVTAGIFAFKVLTVVAFIVLLWAVARLAAHFGIRPSLALWIGVANPVVVIHLIGGLHTESMMMALVTVGFVAALKLRPVPGLLAGSVLIAIGVALKATAAIALPFLVWIIVYRIAGTGPQDWLKETSRRFITLIWTGVVSLVAVLVTMSAITWASGQTWGWIAEMSGNTKVINPLALPSFTASVLAPVLSQFNDEITFNIIVDLVRPWSMLAMLVGLVVVWWLFRHDPKQALIGATVAYAVTCVFNAVTLPWYYVAPLVLFGACVVNRRAIFFVAWASAWLSFMFDGGGNNSLYDLVWVAVIAIATFVILRATLGYTPWSDEEKTDPWSITTRSESGLSVEASDQSHGLGAAANFTS